MSTHSLPTRVTIHRLIEAQLAKRQPPEAWHTFQRLCRSGYAEEDAKRMIVAALATEYFHNLCLGHPADRKRYDRMLQQLPDMPWDDPREPEITEEAVTTEILDNTHLNLMTTDETRDRYQQLRAVLTRMSNEILADVVKDNIAASAEQLGLMQGKVMVFGEESEMSVVLDHALYADPRQRERYLNTYVAAHKSLDDDTALVLDAMRDAVFSVLRVEERIAKLGVQVYDLLHNITYLLLDQSLSRYATPDIILAAHVVAPEGIHMTTGAPLPIADRTTGQCLIEVLKALPEGQTFDAQNRDGKLTTRILRSLLAAGAGEQIAYGEPEAHQLAPTPGPKLPRNAPCPCGSGKKYKQCCGR
ncbi:MAG TPA: SEC-C domain-containing protein [Armatimonadota bacterium]|jgi:hypothetical protein